MIEPMVPVHEPVFIFGAGGHAKSVIGVLVATGRHELVGVLDDDPSRCGATILSHHVLGGMERLANPADRAAGVHVAIGDNACREAVTERVRKAGRRLVTITHPSSFVIVHAILGDGVFLHHGAVVGCDATVGDGTIVSAQAIVGHDCRLGRFVHLAPGVRLAGGVHVGDGAFLGINTVVLPGIHIGRRVTIAAGSIVTRNLPDDAVAAGMPARVVSKNAPAPGQ